jgi:NAD(P)-dependent dehydrogenase (short-subunit alcohol dehydrogenase family)
MTDQTLTGRTVLVTGANGGLGREFVAQALARGAAKVYATARTPQEWDDPRVVPLVLDVTDRAGIQAAVEAAPDVDVLVNNAGVALMTPFLETTEEEVRALFEVNVFGALAVARAFAPVLARDGDGALIDVASVASWRPRPLLAAYAASKAAFASLTDSLRLVLAPQGVHVLGLYLAFSDTPMTAGIDGPKSDPADVVAQTWDGLAAREWEVLADEPTRFVRAGLGDPIAERFPRLAPAR